MAQEDMLADFSERGVYASYLIGELRVEGMDVYDGPGQNKMTTPPQAVGSDLLRTMTATRR